MIDVPLSGPAMERLRAVLLGLLAGGLAGLIGLAFVPGALVLAVFAFVVGALAPPRPFGLSGVLIGSGASLAAVILRADQACRPGECVGPDITPWLWASVVLVVVGIALLAVGLIRARRRT